MRDCVENKIKLNSVIIIIYMLKGSEQYFVTAKNIKVDIK